MENKPERIQDIPKPLRPREKAKSLGIASLSDAELLALFIGNGIQGANAIQIGQRLLTEHSSLADIATLSVSEISKSKGLGIAKSTLLTAAFEIGKRVAQQRIQKVALRNPEQIYQHVKPMFIGLVHESLRVILLDPKMHCLKIIEVSKGTTNQTICHPRDILHHAIVNHAHGIILVHNHPTGNPTPSQADLTITEQIKEACQLLQIKLHDHLIIGQASETHPAFYSFRSEGKL